MKKESHAYACKMGGVFFSEVAAKLSLEELIYWTREPEELLAILKKPGLALIGDLAETFSLAAQERKEVEKVFRLNGPFQKGVPPGWRKAFLYNEYGETSDVTASWYPVQCNILPSEVLEVLGELPRYSHFTPQQIRSLAKNQNSADKEGPLSFEVGNHFPIVGKKGETVFLTVMWDPQHASHKKNQWDYYFPHAQFTGGEKFLRKGTRLFLI